MASELKPWRYEIKYGPEGEDAYSWVYDDHGAMVATMKTHKAKQIVDAMNTRPAPAATDTGLETVEYQVRSKLNGHWVKDNFLSQQLSPDTERRELVTRSQAEELLAAERARADANFDKVIEQAKRAELAELKERWLKEMVAAIISNPIGSPKQLRAVEDARRALNTPEASLYALYEKEELIQRAEKAEADNAAKETRIKELEEEVEWAQNAVLARQRHAEARCETLEAKLAAAEKALERMVSEYDEVDLSHDEPPSMTSAVMEARAVLGGKSL
ncbi:hypothetical protein NIK97_20565 [Brucella pseudintermedia]|uniref:Uncharacterized protein n=1 Tax=Brucella pseudintermedia TaxID=370111 RepID=A0ABY5UFW8_9HYPH|nr:hypothetical protein [Brucella pseudintermedia]UWL62245.1 hypothetical protein NIK97_20565 [Brucella pseudintermedia]